VRQVEQTSEAMSCSCFKKKTKSIQTRRGEGRGRNI